MCSGDVHVFVVVVVDVCSGVCACLYNGLHAYVYVGCVCISLFSTSDHYPICSDVLLLQHHRV